MTWEYFPSQVSVGKEALAVLKQYGLVYLAMEERTGKCGTAMWMAEQLPESVERILVVTKKKALEGWQEALKELPHDKAYVLSTYHSAAKVRGTFQLVILDEAHSYVSGYPKTSILWDSVFAKVFGLPIIYSSATPHAQGYQLLFHQFALSKFGPWRKFADFYEWFREYAQRDEEGRLPTKHINNDLEVTDYTCLQDERIAAELKHLFISYTRKELGFKVEPKDQLHYIKLKPHIQAIYNALVTNRVLEFTHSETGKDYTLVCDTPTKLRYALHMLEGGSLKINDEHISLGNNEKADYIMQTWGDTSDLVIMYHYTADGIKLSRMFKHARVLQGTAYAEGVDLSMHRHLVIYSQDFSTAKHTQRRARQANKHREDEITVHYLLVKKGQSEHAYKTVSVNKKNYVDPVFERI